VQNLEKISVLVYRVCMPTRITIRKPDDWHLHVRDGAMLKAVLPHTAKHFGRAILMPNLIPPVTRLSLGRLYRREALPCERDHELGRRRDRLPQGHARAGTHGKDRHAVPDAR
jgi:hypothetical protein